MEAQHAQSYSSSCNPQYYTPGNQQVDTEMEAQHAQSYSSFCHPQYYTPRNLHVQRLTCIPPDTDQQITTFSDIEVYIEPVADIQIETLPAHTDQQIATFTDIEGDIEPVADIQIETLPAHIEVQTQTPAHAANVNVFTQTAKKKKMVETSFTECPHCRHCKVAAKMKQSTKLFSLKQVQNPLTYVAPISKDPIQPTAVAAIRIPIESPAVRLASMCSKMPIVPSLPAKLSSAGTSYEQSLSAVVGSYGALTGQTVPHVQYQPCSTNTETASSTATLLNSSSTPNSAQNLNSSLTQARMQAESCTATNSQCVYTSTGSGNQTTTISTTETQPKLVPVTGVKPQSKEVTENKSIIPEFQSGKVDAKLFPPRYYDINSLKIGTWKHKFSNRKSRLKIIFSQRKFVYELQLNNGDLVPATGDPQIACIEVPFRTVVGLNISPSPTVEVIIEVDTVPAMWQGTEVLQQRRDGATCTRVQYNRLHTVDLTDGQLSKVPYHEVTISNITIRNHLMNFDPRFSALLRIPIKTDCNKPPPAALKPDVSSKRKKGDQDFTNEESPAHDLESNPKRQQCMQYKNTMASLKVCSGTSGCSSERCNCIKDRMKCQGCMCTSCDSPLNILEEYGVNLVEASKDSCFMQNLPKINNLRALLRSSVATPCCDSLIPLSNCSGEVECPECNAEYHFSWCSRGLCDEEDRPRNAICQTCGDYGVQHCSSCNRFYFAGLCSFGETTRQIQEFDVLRSGIETALVQAFDSSLKSKSYLSGN